jgi:hypothetical protein
VGAGKQTMPDAAPAGSLAKARELDTSSVGARAIAKAAEAKEREDLAAVQAFTNTAGAMECAEAAFMRNTVAAAASMAMFVAVGVMLEAVLATSTLTGAGC